MDHHFRQAKHPDRLQRAAVREAGLSPRGRIETRFLVKATIPVEAGNELVRDPNFGERLQGILDEIKSETAYFTAQDGQRTIYPVVEMEGGHRRPAITEPLWLSLRVMSS